MYPGELREHHCDLYQCRRTVDGLEKWKCEDCVNNSPACVEYEARRLRRNLSRRDEKKALRTKARNRKIMYRRMKRDQILVERKRRRAEIKAARAARREAKARAREAQKQQKMD